MEGEKQLDHQNPNLKDDVTIIVIDRFYNQQFKKYVYYHSIQKSISKGYKYVGPY